LFKTIRNFYFFKMW